jgi:hypothetical protein
MQSQQLASLQQMQDEQKGINKLVSTVAEADQKCKKQ